MDEALLEEPERWVQSACVLCSDGCRAPRRRALMAQPGGDSRTAPGRGPLAPWQAERPRPDRRHRARPDIHALPLRLLGRRRAPRTSWRCSSGIRPASSRTPSTARSRSAPRRRLEPPRPVHPVAGCRSRARSRQCAQGHAQPRAPARLRVSRPSQRQRMGAWRCSLQGGETPQPRARHPQRVPPSGPVVAA